jgi:hypothetical protein
MSSLRDRSSRLERTCTNVEDELWNLIRLWGNCETPAPLSQSEADGHKPSQQRHPALSSRPTT